MTSPDLNAIYSHAAAQYQALVKREDTHQNLLPAILAIDPLTGKDLVELGAGTGRITCQVAPLVSKLIATDISPHMLGFAARNLSIFHPTKGYLCLASHLSLPFASRTADVMLSGWSFCYAALDAGENWQPALEKALAEVARVLRPGGKLILIETLGTGYETPHPPDALQNYFGYLAGHGFETSWIRTDYLFTDEEEAVNLTTFFFGDEPLTMQQTKEGVIVPECTGLWWRGY